MRSLILPTGGLNTSPVSRATRVDRWFSGTDPWPSLEPHRLEVLQRLKERFDPLEDDRTGTKVGYRGGHRRRRRVCHHGRSVVEPSGSCRLRWPPIPRRARSSGPATTSSIRGAPKGGLVDLDAYPRLRAYFESHRI